MELHIPLWLTPILWIVFCALWGVIEGVAKTVRQVWHERNR